MIPFRDNLRCKAWPYVTYTIAIINVLVVMHMSTLAIINVDLVKKFIETYAAQPDKILHAFATHDLHLIFWALMSIVTSMFIHAGWSHLIGNMCFLICFGKGIEARLGKIPFIVFYLLSGFAACALEIARDPGTQVMIGASGAIAGVLGAYVLFWPKSRIYALAAPCIPVKVASFWLLLSWITIQFVSARTDITGSDHVAYYAHIGGFLIGVMTASFWKIYYPKCDICSLPDYTHHVDSSSVLNPNMGICYLSNPGNSSDKRFSGNANESLDSNCQGSLDEISLSNLQSTNTLAITRGKIEVTYARTC